MKELGGCAGGRVGGEGKRGSNLACKKDLLWEFFLKRSQYPEVQQETRRTKRSHEARQGEHAWGREGARRAHLVEAVVRNVLQDDGLHGQHVGKLHLGDVQSTHNVGPAWGSKGRAVVNVLQPRRALCSHRAAVRHGRERRKRALGRKPT